MKITIDCRMWGKTYGGIGRYTREIVLWFLGNKKWHYFLLVSSASYKELKDYAVFDNVCLIPFDVPILSIKEQIILWRKIPRCDLFWSPYMNVPFLPCFAKKRVVTLHDVFHIANPQYYSFLKRMAVKPYYFFAVKRSDVILTVSEFSKKEICKYFGRRVGGKVKCIYNGCDINTNNICSTHIDYDYFLFVSNIKPHKNLKNALLAFKALEERNIKFVIVGKKEGFITGDTKIIELVKDINLREERVIFTGNIDDIELYEWYKDAKALIFPSFYEGFGLPIIEAMQFNLPIICSDIPVFREIGKENLLYFDPNDPSDICKRMVDVLSGNDVSYPYWITWKETALLTASLFEDIVKNRHATPFKNN